MPNFSLTIACFLKTMKYSLPLILFICLFTAGLCFSVDVADGTEHTRSKFSASIQERIWRHEVDIENHERRALAATDSDKIWIFFNTKLPVGTPPDYREKMLSEFRTKYLTERAALRRAKSTAEIFDDSDLPVFQSYLDVISPIKEVNIKSTSRWLNAISISTTSNEALIQIASLPFVTFIDRVGQLKRNIDAMAEDDSMATNKDDKRATSQQVGLDYGDSLAQLDLVKVPNAHRRNYTGKGVIIMIMDSGFYKEHECFSGANIIDEWDFVQDDKDVQDRPGEGRMGHGTQAWSNMGGRCPGHLYGPAYEASFLLAKTEDIRIENVVEEDNFVAALEWGERLGADVVSASLGYDQWYSWSDLNGLKAVTTKGVNIATKKGVIVVVAQGNSGTSSKVIPVPADGFDVISVGAVSTSGDLASFSSLGPTFDGRIKPEVVAPGVSNVVAGTNTPQSYGRNSGTSFATPIIAGVAALVLQAHPDWTNTMVREALMKTSSHSSTPDIRRGWGIANAIAAIDYSFAGKGCPDGQCFSCSSAMGCECNGDLYNYFCDAQRVDCRSFCEGTCGDDNICRCTNRFGRCVPSSDLLTSWQCPTEWYNAGDGICNCECGAEDPDCRNQTSVHVLVQQTIGCHIGHTCLSGRCISSNDVASGAIAYTPITIAWLFLIWKALY